MPGVVEIDTEHRQGPGEVDSHVIDAGWDQSRVLLPCVAGVNFCRVCCLNSPTKRALNDQSRVRPNDAHEPQVSLRGAGKSGDVVVGDWCGVDWAGGKVQLADTRLGPASHANTGNP
jgi:hypothetical protein